ncbi:lantibiotic dehydratase C-terminal domain-containing protein [Streptomyces purpureus]|uniref:Thiopeptide-type bacteriocin biosynthesis domain-containing protein n=1 Tax=Streptomyces purpureus TaxID=1951 RepID=A0A918LWC8_9ACTN|nr:lantibiotic dehydratase C-terminal domain-containing protein [Streptomyces purpureus]GGT59529.1 hypothetical protein GCM10014713_61280 [Streptomyces purpureus]
MTRNWLYCRLSGQAWADQGAALTPRLPAAVAGALAPVLNGRAGHWFFHPLREASGTPGTELWLDADASITQDVLTALLAEADRTGSRMFHRYEERAAAFTDELSMRSSAFALAVAEAGGLPVADRLTLAVLHLRHVAALVPSADRAAFLFLCWQHWAAGIDPDQRLALGRRATADGAALLELATALPVSLVGGRRTADTWRGYLRTLDTAVSDQEVSCELPGTYLLFEHAHLTHRRLGISREAEALAALVLRTAPESAFLTTPVLQRV